MNPNSLADAIVSNAAKSGVPAQGAKTIHGSRGDSAVASGMHSLDKLKEYESKLLMQNSQTHLNNSAQPANQPRKVEQQKKFSEQKRGSNRPFSNRQQMNLLEKKQEK
jgi:hypothetical protein